MRSRLAALPSLATFLAVFLLAAVPAQAVGGGFLDGQQFAFWAGTAIVAGATTIGVRVARNHGWVVRLGLTVFTVALLPFVAGGSTGLALGLFAPPGGDPVWRVVDVGLAGARWLYPMLFTASVAAWVLAAATSWAAERLVARAARG